MKRKEKILEALRWLAFFLFVGLLLFGLNEFHKWKASEGVREKISPDTRQS